ncbi:MAG: hypothetical protein OJF49_002661 [Ktedonobacterales bacterium]|nr:MAG: hypothetical protein OJF49_002661 [Ktedonobacterales bacterium]
MTRYWAATAGAPAAIAGVWSEERGGGEGWDGGVAVDRNAVALFVPL